MLTSRQRLKFQFLRIKIKLSKFEIIIESTRTVKNLFADENCVSNEIHWEWWKPAKIEARNFARKSRHFI